MLEVTVLVKEDFRHLSGEILRGISEDVQFHQDSFDDENVIHRGGFFTVGENEAIAATWSIEEKE